MIYIKTINLNLTVWYLVSFIPLFFVYFIRIKNLVLVIRKNLKKYLLYFFSRPFILVIFAFRPPSFIILGSRLLCFPLEIVIAVIIIIV